MRRLHCAIPRCKRWHAEETALGWGWTPHTRFICRDHWRGLTKAEKAVWRRINRQAKVWGDEAVAERRARVFEAFVRRLSE